MGELIRNIKEIKIGGETLMIEENEGYSAKQGRLIHIQNSDFRYLLTEKGFMQLLTTILRAKEEKEYYRSRYPGRSSEGKSAAFAAATPKTKALGRKLGAFFEKNRVRYRFVESGERFLTFLIHPEDHAALKKALENVHTLKKQKHIYGKAMGYEFLYQMRPFELYSYADIYIEFYFQVPCMSLTPKTWIPLDRKLQKRAWEQDKRRGSLKVLDDVTYYIYRLCWAVFNRGFFSQHDREVLDEYAGALNDPQMDELLQVVFFGYTAHLLELLAAREYDRVIPDYYSFDQY